MQYGLYVWWYISVCVTSAFNKYAYKPVQNRTVEGLKLFGQRLECS